VPWAQIKIDTPIRFPVDLDYCRVLRGCGRPLDFTGLLRQFLASVNNAHVSDLSESAVLVIGYGQVDLRTASLLFYECGDFENAAPDPEIAEDLRNARTTSTASSALLHFGVLRSPLRFVPIHDTPFAGGGTWLGALRLLGLKS
jgi:hypothetical protein